MGIFTCTHAATVGGAKATTTYTCGNSGAFAEGSAVTCPLSAPTQTCDGSSITLANAARSGGTATGTPPAAAGATEADGSTIIFTCTYGAAGVTATSTFTCGSGTFTAAATVVCPSAAPTCDGSAVTEATAARSGGDATGGPTGAAGQPKPLQRRSSS